MEYKYTQAHESYEVYAAGGVFYSAPGLTAFPVRLAVEIFRRCQAIRAAQGARGSAVVYDPCCGGAYHLATMAYFNWEQIAGIYCSDIDDDALRVARRNLSLLTVAGMDRRIEALADFGERFGKQSHIEALQNAHILRQRLVELNHGHTIQPGIFRADATDRQAIVTAMGDVKVDIAMADIPYGQAVAWRADTAALVAEREPVEEMLEALLSVLEKGAVVAVAAAKKDKIRHDRFRRLERFSVGRRQVAILQPA